MFLEYYDEELWTMIANTAVGKKKINNSHYFKTIHSALTKLNQSPECGL